MRLETPEKDLTELRRQAGACLGDFVGLEPTDWQAPAGTQLFSCDLHPGGELLAIVLFGPTTSGQFTSEVRLRNFVTGQEIGRLRPERGLLFCVKFSADGKRLFTGELNGVVGVWQVDAAGNWRRERTYRGIRIERLRLADAALPVLSFLAEAHSFSARR